MSAALVGCGTDAETHLIAKPSPRPTAHRPAGPEPGGLTAVFPRGAVSDHAAGAEGAGAEGAGANASDTDTESAGRPAAGAEVRAAAKIVALTFDADMTVDQGPRAARGERFDNPNLIASLRRLEVPSTIFMTGRWAEEYPSQARSIGSDPLFEVANHSYSHHSFTPDCYGLPVLAKEDMAADVERAFAAFRQVGVRKVVPYLRFPGGCFDQSALRTLAPANLTAVQWDVVSGDAFATDADAVAEQVLSGVKPGSLVVMHCTRSAAPATDEAVQRIVPELRERGYRFVKVSDLMKG